MLGQNLPSPTNNRSRSVGFAESIGAIDLWAIDPLSVGSGGFCTTVVVITWMIG
jgi:hypothetical protein